jgi:hypothetical protein
VSNPILNDDYVEYIETSKNIFNEAMRAAQEERQWEQVKRNLKRKIRGERRFSEFNIQPIE